ncbi:hypothetical protein QBK95_14800 [Aquimarina sp. 2201CG14-23]|nr:hypothetical protein [Aquimarina sp. 2201CG14-23]
MHSPFVFNLITKCFYDRKKKKSYPEIKSIAKNNTIEISFKNAKLLNRLIPYFNYKNILISENTATSISKILSIGNTISISDTYKNKVQFDFCFINITELNTNLIETIFSKVHNDSLVLINAIHTSKESKLIWDQIVSHPKTKVTIDTYDLGFIFFRKEQVKEHFVIRM